MNRVELVGRLTRDPEMRMSQSGVAVARFTVAVNRIRKVEGQPEADFINCVTIGKPAEFMEKYMKKGYLVSVEGRIRTGSYQNQNGQRIYTTEIFCDSVQNLTPRKNTEDSNENTYPDEHDSMASTLDISSDDLPF